MDAAYARRRDQSHASYEDARSEGKITVVRVAAGYGQDTTVEVHEPNCPCLGCAQWRTGEEQGR